ncbi:TPA: GNAT family N-acetyltransferase [Klebsiella pneumoniae]|uniref:GNAT family N-acetyltransferase n=3 Tax=Klebsiella pneumoniae complex TaxID=3390273 RepID=A0A7H0EKG6_KLEVA|nr:MULTISPECIES: GNAT family N-acetyltransferase [Klebsiella]AJF71458.1 acetyltransferase [Raoultella ornithinolytica]EIY2678660.1 GNAT family N-acetyltransferase [Raoultella planticola]HDS7208193.1 GNAT family N-acetyltransferase [Klebsiella quasipneumoniae subsp. similipneumoniae]HDU4704043.1 GNAT family N-acetyltransferase [Klebsiella pneumoniae subsp. pneumoniae]EIX9340935.1 GNAT family N-acetyltransferase [Klebsiella pneumoniae]
MSANIESQFRVVKADSDVKLTGVKQFDCGDKVLNGYLQQLKRQCGHDNINGLLLLEGDKVIGFVTASLYQLSREDVPKGTFPYSVPPVFTVMKIPMIAIDKQYQRQGWGDELLRAILDYCIDSADLVRGIKGVYLDAKVGVKDFYESFDFEAISEEITANNTIPMFISMDTLRQAKELEKSA